MKNTKQKSKENIGERGKERLKERRLREKREECSQI
jgi:hypothetical protein